MKRAARTSSQDSSAVFRLEGRTRRRDDAAAGHAIAVRLDGTSIIEHSRPDMLIECVFDRGTAEIKALPRAHGYRFYLVDEAALGLDPVDDLAPSGTPDMDRVNRFVTTRPAEQVADLARDVRARLDAGARLAHGDAND